MGRIVTTEEVLDEVVKRYGYDKSLLRKLYREAIQTISDSARSGNSVAIEIPKFGVVYLTVKGATMRKYKYRVDMYLSIKRYNFHRKAKIPKKEVIDSFEQQIKDAWRNAEFYDHLHQMAYSYALELKSLGQNNVAYLERGHRKSKILNV